MQKLLNQWVVVASLFILVFSSSAFAANSVIDVLVVYTKGVSDTYGGDPTTRFNQLVQVTNQIYRDSDVNLEIRIAKTVEVNYTDDNSASTALNDITYVSHPAFENIAALREQVGADMVVFYRPYKAIHGTCGLAWIGGDNSNTNDAKKYMFAHVGINSCGDYVTAHEMGHNMGLKHSRKQDGAGGAFPYALGYGVENKFTTIMAYQSEFNVDYWEGKMYKFSNPNLTCSGLPCGIDRNDPINGADAHYAINITGPRIANFYESLPPIANTVSQSNTSVSTSINTGINTDTNSSVSNINNNLSRGDLGYNEERKNLRWVSHK